MTLCLFLCVSKDEREREKDEETLERVTCFLIFSQRFSKKDDTVGS